MAFEGPLRALGIAAAGGLIVHLVDEFNTSNAWEASGEPLFVKWPVTYNVGEQGWLEIPFNSATLTFATIILFFVARRLMFR